MQGLHQPIGNDETSRARVVRGVLGKMSQDKTRQSRSSRGSKFAMVAVDPRRLGQDNVLSLPSSGTRKKFAERYGPGNKHGNRNWLGMYDQHAKEGVAAVKGGIPRSAIVGLRAFRGVPEQEDMEKILNELGSVTDDEESDESSDGGVPTEHPGKSWKDDRDPPPPGGTGVTAY